MNAAAQSSWTILDMLAEALANPGASGFEVHYQPIVRLDNGAIIAVEALARWRHPIAGDIDPNVFVLVAERAGMMGTLDDFVLTSACVDANALNDLLGVPANLHVNICAARLGQPSLEWAILRAIDELHFETNRLVVEITETSRIPDLTAAAAAIRRLRTRGVRFALDDFGSGFNALSQLHALPVDCIKLAAALIDLDGDPLRAESLCRSVLTICGHIGAPVFAEGIETQEQAQMLMRVGCSMGQGHLYGRAQPLEMLRAVG